MCACRVFFDNISTARSAKTQERQAIARDSRCKQLTHYRAQFQKCSTRQNLSTRSHSTCNSLYRTGLCCTTYRSKTPRARIADLELEQAQQVQGKHTHGGSHHLQYGESQKKYTTTRRQRFVALSMRHGCDPATISSRQIEAARACTQNLEATVHPHKRRPRPASSEFHGSDST